MNLIRTGTLLGAIAVMIGAFGAHGLKKLIAIDQLAIFETGVRYHFYHALAICFAGLYLLHNNSKKTYYAGICFLIGIFLFSGSLYLLACRVPLGIEGWRGLLGPLTPIGGVFFIVGWILLFLSADQPSKR